MHGAADFSRIPIVDVSDLLAGRDGRFRVARELAAACAESGFFYAVGHGVDPELLRELHEHSQCFFALPQDVKLRIRMAHGGRAWRG